MHSLSPQYDPYDYDLHTGEFTVLFSVKQDTQTVFEGLYTSKPYVSLYLPHSHSTVSSSPFFLMQVILRQIWLMRGSMSSRPTMSFQRSSKTSCSISIKPSLIWLIRRCMSCSPIVSPVRVLSKRSMRSRMFMRTGNLHTDDNVFNWDSSLECYDCVYIFIYIYIFI